MSLAMTRIAQISDLHLVEDRWHERGRAERLRLSLVNFMRRPDPTARRERALAALDSARQADHIVVTGDLTDDGTDAQFEVLAEVLAESRIDPRRVTLVGGNHDGYSDGFALDRALEGPLAEFRPTSARGAFTVLDDVVIVPLSTVVHQPITSSSGRIAASELRGAKEVLDRTASRRRSLVVALHHPPLRSWFPVAQAIDGLDNAGETERMLEAYPKLFALHGHVHRRNDRTLRRESRPRVFSSDAIAASAEHVRLYHADSDEVVPFDEAPGAALVPAMA
jgi:3',5'-cyclic-AMP phosphodiesterase